MTLKIHELGGMTEGDIQALVFRNNAEQREMLEKKFTEQSAQLNARLDEQDRVIMPMRDNMIALVGSEQVEGMIPAQTKILAALAADFKAAREEDIAFRAKAQDDIDTLRSKQEDDSAKLERLNWIVTTTGLLGKVGRGLLKVFTTGKDIHKTVLVGGLLYVGYTQAVRIAHKYFHF